MTEQFNQSESSFKPCEINATYCYIFKIQHGALIWKREDREMILTYANAKLILVEIDDCYNHLEILIEDEEYATAIQLTEDLMPVADYMMENGYEIHYKPVPDLLTLEWYKNMEIGKATLELQNVEDIIEAWSEDEDN